jgi:putative SOS response-associated peptidase YedK
MCGRYSLICIDDLGNRFRVCNPMIGARSKFNVAPASEMPVIVRDTEDRVLPMRWGLVPHWTRNLRSAPRPINARAESLREKPMFGPLLRSGRCLVPASGFFEWKTEGSHKVPFYITLSREPLFAFAGLFDTWAGPDRSPLLTYTIVTCEPNALLAKVHNRMPVILTRENEERWLGHGPIAPQDLPHILAPYPAGAMEMVQVSDLVNNPGIDDERVVQPFVSSAGRQTLLPG